MICAIINRFAIKFMHVFKLIWNQGHTRIDNWWGGGGAVIRIFMLANLKNNRFQKKVIG